jgi:predicted NUDIX family phosphoesterase
MTDDTVNSQELPTDISDEEADKLFENGGILDEPKAEPEEESTEDEKELEAELEPEETEEEPKKEEKKVNLGALHEERAKRKELEGTVKQQAEKQAKMEERFQQLVSSLTTPKQENQLPSVEDDPVTNLDARLKESENFQKQYQQNQQNQAFTQQVETAYRIKANEYTADNPDFKDAYKYVLDNRLEELQVNGLSKQEAIALAQQEEFGIALKALQDGANPAERIYKIAQLRGYKKAEAKSEQKKDLSVIEKGQKNSKVSGSATPEGELSLEALAEMDDAEFEAAWKKLEKSNSK